MNRRNFLKTVTGFVAGVFISTAKSSEKYDWKFVVAPYNGKGNSDGIEIYGTKEEIKEWDYSETAWNNLGCKNCFRGCGQWDDCMATLRKRQAQKAVNPPGLNKYPSLTIK